MDFENYRWPSLAVDRGDDHQTTILLDSGTPGEPEAGADGAGSAGGRIARSAIAGQPAATGSARASVRTGAHAYPTVTAGYARSLKHISDIGCSGMRLLFMTQFEESFLSPEKIY